MSRPGRLTFAGLARASGERWLARSAARTTAAGLTGLAVMMAPARLSG